MFFDYNHVNLNARLNLIESSLLVAHDQKKTNVLLNLIKCHRPDIGKIYLYVKDPYESKCQLLINGREKVGIEILKNPKAFID